jgi:hypothetical protein
VVSAFPLPLCAQNGTVETTRAVLLPDERVFASPVADPLEPRFAIGLVRTSLFETRGPERPLYRRSPGTAAEVQATAAIGTTIPLVRMATRAGGPRILIAAQAAVFARFRVEHPSRDDLSQDWVVGVPIELAWTRTQARLRIVHRSAHLGDEFVESTGAQRIEMGGEAVEALLARRLGSLRLYGGGGWIFHSNTDNTEVLLRNERADRFSLQAGGDAILRPFANPHWSLAAGADWQSAQRSNWRSTFALAAALRAEAGSREVRLSARYAGGASTVGQFFLTSEQAWTLELQLGT